MANTTDTHEIDLRPNLGMGEHYWTSCDLNGGVVVRMYGKHQCHVTQFYVGYVDNAATLPQPGRTPRPAAYLIPQPVIIAARPIKRDIRVIDVTEGTRLLIDGFEYEIRDDRPLHDPQLYRVGS